MMRRRTRGFEAAALVDGDVHDHTAAPHPAQHIAANQLGRPGTGHEHRRDQQVHRGQQFNQMRFVGIQGMRRVQCDVQKAHAFEVHFQHRHIRANPCGHARGVDAGHAAADHDYPSGQDARHPAQQHAAAAAVFRQEVCAHDHRHAAGDFTHRFEQR